MNKALSKKVIEPLHTQSSLRKVAIVRSKRRGLMLKMFMISLVSMGIIIGVNAADLFEPIAGLFWTLFFITALLFLLLSRWERPSGQKDG